MSQQEKAARRAALRNEYWRTMTNPHNHLRGESGGVVSEPSPFEMAEGA